MHANSARLMAGAFLVGCVAGCVAPASAQIALPPQTVHSTETNLTLGTAQTIDTSIVTFDATLNASNADFVHQNASSFTPSGQNVSPMFFKYGSSAVQVDSEIDVLGHATTFGTPGATNYFSFTQSAGSVISMYGTATSPANQATEIFLYDNVGNVLAVADANAPDGHSSLINFTVPSGGTWNASITQGSGFTAPFDYSLQFKPFQTTSLFTTNVIGNGTLSGGSLGLYTVNADDGDQLSFDVHATTPSTPTQLFLLDRSGNIVAAAAGNGSDGFSSLINFTVPSGGAGDWRIEVLPAVQSNAYAYDLAIQGASGLGPVDPIAVPEPATWIMLLTGFGALCLALSGRAEKLSRGRFAKPLLYSPP